MIRQRVLLDHDALRKQIEVLETLTREVLDDERHLIGPLRERAETLLESLSEHARWEERHLPELHRPDTTYAAELAREHREQCAQLREAVERLREEARPAPTIGRELADLVVRLRRDMQAEEQALP